MIKETIDAVREAESQAEQIVSRAEEEAVNQKNNVKVQTQEYRTEALNNAKKQAQEDMARTVSECDAYQKQAGQDIDNKVEMLKKEAAGKSDAAIDAIIEALV